MTEQQRSATYDIANDKIPRISVGMPVYNGEKYISDAIDSLLLQTYTDFELIISDNASSDGTEKICLEYAKKDSRIRYVRQIKNQGGFCNFKFVLDEARGEYFMWLAHDDYIEPDSYLEKLVQPLVEGYEFSFPNVQIVSAGGLIVANNVMGLFATCNSRLEMCESAIKINSYQVYGLFMRSKLHSSFRYLVQCKKLFCFGEGLFVHSIFNEYRGKFIDNVFFNYRRHELNQSSTRKIRLLIKDFIHFTLYDIYYWSRRSKLKAFGTSKIISLVIFYHGKYLIKLHLVAVKRFLLRTIRLS